MAKSRDGGGLDFNTAQPINLAVIDETRLHRLREALQARAADLARQVFPGAHIGAHEARIGDLDGNPGESLSITLDTGLWFDHATGEGGDLIELWRATAHTTFPQAIDDLEHWCGLAHAKRPKWSSPIIKLGAARSSQASERPALGAPVQTWHYFAQDGTILGKVSRYALPNGNKTYRPFNARGESTPPDPRPLYRLPKIRASRTVILVEGEKCADALEAIGHEATSAMGGASADIEKTDWSPLAGKSVILWPDNDQVGRDFMVRVEPVLTAIGCSTSWVTVPADKPDKWDAADAVEAGEEIADLLPRETSPQRFRLLTIAELRSLKPPEWRVDGIFPTHGSSVIYGPFGSFKSFLALDLALCLVTGREWHGRAVKPCGVVYVAGEGQFGFAPRVLGWLASHKIDYDPADFRVIAEAVALPSHGDVEHLLRAVDASGIEPGLIVFDTVTRMAGGGSLNDEKDVQAYVRASDRIRTATGAHVMHLGHTGKDADKGIMGSVVLPAAMETIIYLERRASSVTLVNEHPKGKQKDGPNFENLRFALREFHFGEPDASTLILVPDNDIVSGAGGPREQKLGTRQQKIIDFLTTAQAQGQTLGFNRLGMMSGLDNGSLSKTLRDLADKGRIEKTDDGTWKLP